MAAKDQANVQTNLEAPAQPSPTFKPTSKLRLRPALAKSQGLIPGQHLIFKALVALQHGVQLQKLSYLSLSIVSVLGLA